MEDLAERFQAFYGLLEDDLRNAAPGGGSGLGEGRVREVMEVVEKVICELFYDRCVSHASFLSSVKLAGIRSSRLVPKIKTDYSSNRPQTTPRTTKPSQAASQH